MNSDDPRAPVTQQDVYQAWHGTSEPWGGCADSVAVERVFELISSRMSAWDAQVHAIGTIHTPEPVHAPADECGHTDDDGHDTFESRDGDRLCVDGTSGYCCSTCRDSDGEPVSWPCATHQVIAAQ